MIEGECNCGAVAFKIKSQITGVYICHCSICRKTTGGGGFAVVIVNSNKLSWAQGKDNINYWVKPGHEWHTSFCRICGSPLPGKNDNTNTYIPVGSLTSGHENLKVAHHIWVGSKASWEEIGDSGKQHAQGFGE